MSNSNGWWNFAERHAEFETQQQLDQQRLRKLAADAANGILPDDCDPEDPDIISVTTPDQRIAMAEAKKGKK